MLQIIWHYILLAGNVASSILTFILLVYLIPNSPLKAVVDSWIGRGVSNHFDKELATFRHRLDLDAEQVRSEHRRLLHNAELVNERKHEIYREVFRLLHIANGAVSCLYCIGEAPDLDKYGSDDLAQYMDSLRIGQELKAEILSVWWNEDKKSAISQIRSIARQADIRAGEKSFHEAKNYYLLNSLYLDDAVSEALYDFFSPLNRIILQAKIPDAKKAKEVFDDIKVASEKLEMVRSLFRERLRVEEPSIKNGEGERGV